MNITEELERHAKLVMPNYPDDVCSRAKVEIERLKLAKAQQTAQADMRSAENVKLRQALKAAQQKLVIYREGANGEYKGGMEYTSLMQMIDRAFEQRGDKNDEG